MTCKSLATPEEITSTLGIQGVSNYPRISIKRKKETIITDTYILTYGTLKSLKKIKIGYNIEPVELYTPASLRCIRCQKFGHHRDSCSSCPTCGKCGKSHSDHSEEECHNEIRCANCQESHPAYSRTCDF